MDVYVVLRTTVVGNYSFYTTEQTKVVKAFYSMSKAKKYANKQNESSRTRGVFWAQKIKVETGEEL